jgi:hypothetical protein
VALYRLQSTRAGHSLQLTDKLKIFERKFLTKIYGPNHIKGVWKIKWNDELYKLFQKSNIVHSIKISRLKWL